MPSQVPEGSTRGWIVPIGGGEDKENDPQILRRFVALCGGADADIAVIPTASKLADTGARYEVAFRALGAGRVAVLDFDSRADAADAGKLERLGRANGIFFTGGNQLSLSTILGGTAVARLVRQRNAEGVHVAGTSAGASFISEHMIAFGEEGGTPVAGSVRLAPGLGLTNRVVIDQHFRQRDRLGRLLTALAYNPFAAGIGLDEDTAAFISPYNVIEVEGSGGITLVDASGIEFSSMDQVDEGEPVCMLGVRLHLLVAGARFDLATRQASPGTLARPT
jgi:cyanophycinase